MFLSHKRTTGQAVAGRIYESFKVMAAQSSLTNLQNDYIVFLDSEAHFKLHDLEILVSQTDVFVLILSRDYVTSEWCLKELKSAILNKIKVLT
jgi:hypothetical protein